MAGLYNAKYFASRPEIAEAPGILYCVVLVNKTSNERECMKIGIAKGKTWKDAVKRSFGFKGYDLRIQRIYSSTLFDVWSREQALHAKWKHKQKIPLVHFAGYTECFEICPEILADFPKNKS
jgi:hypothetical protein